MSTKYQKLPEKQAPGHYESEVLRFMSLWCGREGTVSLSSPCTDGNAVPQVGERFRRAFYLKCNCFYKRARNTTASHPWPVFPSLSQYSPLLYRLLWGVWTVLLKNRWRGNCQWKLFFFLPASDRLIRSKGCLMSSVRPVCGEIKLLSIQNDFHLISFDQFLARHYTIRAAEKGSVASLAIITLRRDLIQIIPDKNKHKHCLLRRDKIN